MPGGRPTDYTDQTIAQVKEYLDGCVDEVRQVISGESEKFTSYKEKTVVRLPTIEGLAVFLKVHRDTIHQWTKDHAEFSDIINTLKGIQAERLINMSLGGDYNPLISKLMLAKNHGYVERQEITGADGEKLLPINIIMPPGE